MFVSVCLWLSLSVSVCLYLSLSVSGCCVCLCLTVSLSLCPSLSRFGLIQARFSLTQAPISAFASDVMRDLSILRLFSVLTRLIPSLSDVELVEDGPALAVVRCLVHCVSCPKLRRTCHPPIYTPSPSQSQNVNER